MNADFQRIYRGNIDVALMDASARAKSVMQSGRETQLADAWLQKSYDVDNLYGKDWKSVRERDRKEHKEAVEKELGMFSSESALWGDLAKEFPDKASVFEKARQVARKYADKASKTLSDLVRKNPPWWKKVDGKIVYLNGCVCNATDAKGRPLREDNIQGFKDANGRLLRVGDVIETIKGVEKGHRSKIVGFKGLYVFCDDGGQISRGYCDMVKVVNSSVSKSVNAGTSEGAKKGWETREGGGSSVDKETRDAEASLGLGSYEDPKTARMKAKLAKMQERNAALRADIDKRKAHVAEMKKALGVNSTDKVVANALKYAVRTATNGIRKDEFTGKQANRKWKVGAKAKDMFGNKGTVTEIFNEDQVGWTNGKSKVQMLFQNDDLTACNSQCGLASVAVRNSDAGNCNSCANGCKGHKCRLGLSTKVAMNSGRKCQAWRADSLTRAVKRVVVNAIHVAGNMSAETAISRIEWMLGSSRREDRDEAAAELENYRDLIIARAGKAKYDEMMRRACNGEVTAVNMSKPPALGKALFDAIGYSKVLRNYGSRDGSGGVVLKVTYPEFMGLGFDSVVSRANAFWKRWGYAGKWSVSKMSEKNDKGVLTLVVEIKEM